MSSPNRDLGTKMINDPSNPLSQNTQLNHGGKVVSSDDGDAYQQKMESHRSYRALNFR